MINVHISDQNEHNCTLFFLNIESNKCVDKNMFLEEFY